MSDSNQIRLPFGSAFFLIETTVTPIEDQGDSIPIVTNELLLLTATFHVVTAAIRLILQGVNDASELHGAFKVHINGYTYSGSVTYQANALPEALQPEWNETAEVLIAQAMQAVSNELLCLNARDVIRQLTMALVLQIGKITSSNSRGAFDRLKQYRRTQLPRSRFGERGTSFGSGGARFNQGRFPKNRPEQ